jgi:hypothetical protein
MNRFMISSCKIPEKLLFFMNCPICSIYFKCNTGLFIHCNFIGSSWVCSEECANMYIFQRL